MAVRLLFPTYVFHRYLLDVNLPEDRGVDQLYLNLLKDTMDDMRKRDPIGRQISNAYTGWQSNDGCETNPAFVKLLRRIERTFYDEVLPFHGIDENNVKLQIGNCWANINDKGAWNRPHLHNGCWYSGVFYIRGDGDEGSISFIDAMPKVVSDFPPCQRTRGEESFRPITGELILFPSAAMHMVEPNQTDKDRYSISFNTVVRPKNGRSWNGEIENYDPNEFVFDLDQKGNPIFHN